MKIPSPIECGLPEWITEWRASQEQAIDSMVNSAKRVTALSAPTGFGKSAAYMAASLLSEKPTCIVTNSRGLQDQLMRDYAEIGLVDIRGRGNYQCDMREDFSCEDGYAASCPYKGTVGCPASKAEMRAAASPLVVTNYDKWIASRRYGQGLSHFSQVVFDEGHDAPDAIAKAMQVFLSFESIDKDLQMDYPLETGNFGNWKIWATRAKAVAEELMNNQMAKINNASAPKTSWIKQYFHLRRMARDLGVLEVGHPLNWVVDEVDGGFQFDPIRPSRYAESTLFLRTPRIIIVSATLTTKTMWMLGLKKEEYEFSEFPSDFEASRCPTYYVPTMRVDARAHDLSILWVRLDQIISRRRDRKGIIHSISYARRDDILGRSRFASSMVINPKGEPATDVVERFKTALPGAILVSPSVSTGYDFPGKACEWQFMCKIPFQDGRSKIHKARQEDDKEYGAHVAMQAMVQAFGRGMRSKTDQCENFIGDDHLEWFMPRFRHLAPKSFHQFFKRVEVLPQPPERLP